MSYEISIESRFFIGGTSIDQSIGFEEELSKALNFAAAYKVMFPEFKHHSIVVREYNSINQTHGKILERF
jgi:hypothetical protein